MGTTTTRLVLCGVILALGQGSRLALARLNETERPPLSRPLATLPLEMGDWSGKDEHVDPEIVERAQTTEYLNRVYESPRHPGRRMRLWINYSRFGDNLRHTPEICLPSGGWTKIESRTREAAIDPAGAAAEKVSLLAYSRGDLVENVGFWYYIFGEGRLENYVRRLPITSRSSHGRTTRGSSMTIEVFAPGDDDPESAAMIDFARTTLANLEPILPRPRAQYYVP